MTQSSAKSHDENVGDNAGETRTILEHGTSASSMLRRRRGNSEINENIEFVTEDAVYPNTRAFQIKKSLSRRGIMEPEEELSNIDLRASTEDEPKIDFLQDPRIEMLFGRRICLRFLYSDWYNPRAKKERQLRDLREAIKEKNSGIISSNECIESEDSNEDVENPASLEEFPTLRKAWAYFEHVVLSRYVVQEHNIDVDNMSVFQKIKHSFTNSEEEFERAQPGEKSLRTKLYDPITTPHAQLGDFGMGFGLYFSTIRAIGCLTFAAGLISIFNLYFFASGTYRLESFPNPLLYGSAICTQTEWKYCVDCNCTAPDNGQGWYRTPLRCEELEPPLGGPNVTFALKNECLDDPRQMWRLGLVNYVANIFLQLSIIWLGYYLDRQAILFDEDEQSAQDYSVVIHNPPKSATDPETWRRYFEQTFPGIRCAAITCAVNNDILLRALVRRREVLRMMELQLDPGTPMDIDHLALLAANKAKGRKCFKIYRALFFPRLPELLSELVALNTSIKGLAQLSYPCTNVYVTFEHEKDKRQVLRKLSVGYRDIRRNNEKALGDAKYLFQGKVLNVSESVEPNSVRWQDLNATKTDRTNQMFVTNLLTAGCIVVAALIVRWAQDNFRFGAYLITAFNICFPEFAKIICLMESHPTESSLQRSLYLKIAVFRFVNTAIIITILTPFTQTIAADPDDDYGPRGLIPQICAIFIAEIFTTNLIQVADPWEHFKRHILAPRANTQDAMNLMFQGSEVELAERYTNMTKIMFLAFWYCSIFPASLFLCSAALFVNYYTDRFAMMRTWKKAAHISTEISECSRNYFFSTSCLFLAVMSSFYWSAFPFDNLCPKNDPIPSELLGYYPELDLTLANNDTAYEFCQQDYILGDDGPRFPFIYRNEPGGGEWMSDEQRLLSYIFGWTSVIILIWTGIKFFGFLATGFQHQFDREFQELGQEQGEAFHDVRNINGYIPQVRSKIFSYPMIACNCDKIGEHLYDWTDHDKDYVFYDLTKDADHVLSGTRRRSELSFSRVKHYPPNSRLEDIKRRKRELEARVQQSRSIFNSKSTSHGEGKKRNRKGTIASVQETTEFLSDDGESKSSDSLLDS